jgi:hypothetical protein
MSNPLDPIIRVELPLSVWRLVFELMGRNSYHEVPPVMSLVEPQICQQIAAANQASDPSKPADLEAPLPTVN